jgi:hypothetical protein
MYNSNRIEAIKENVEIFLTLVEKSREKKNIRDHLISLKMEYIPETNDCEIFLDQVDGRVSSISRVKNNGSGSRRNSRKPKIKKRQAKTINEETKYFMDRIHRAQRNRKIEAIILEHNFESRVTDLFLAYESN